MSVRVRLYRSGDFESVLPLFGEVSRFYQGGGAATGEHLRRYVEHQVLGRGSAMRLALALFAEIPAGFAAFTVLHPGPSATGQLFLKELFVTETQRGGGAGRALLRFLAAYALQNGCSRLDWTGETGNPNGLGFYRALGIAPLEDKVYFRLCGESLQAFAETGKAL